MVYADLSRIRQLAGGITTTTISDAEVDEIILYSDNMVNAETGKNDWISTDIMWSLVQAASEFFASARIRDMFSDPDRVSNDHYQTALDICARIVKSFGSGNLAGVVIRSKGYSSYPLNPDGEIYLSVARGTGFLRPTPNDVV